MDNDALAHEIWAAARLLPGEGILDAVDRIVEILERREDCEGCFYLHAGSNDCTLDVGNNCIRQAEDYYKSKESHG